MSLAIVGFPSSTQPTFLGQPRHCGCFSQVAAGNQEKIVAIDIETGIFEVADEILTATDRLFERLPDAQPWIVRIGDRAVHRFGARSLKQLSSVRCR